MHALLLGLLFTAFLPSQNNTQLYNGQCTVQSHIAEGGVDEDLTKRRSRYFCDTAVISALNNDATHIMIQFGEKRAHHGTLLAFAGVTDKGILDVERIYFEPEVPTFATDGACRLFFENDHLTSIVCGAEIIEEVLPFFFCSTFFF